MGKTICLCMIVKNEIKILKDCFNSIVDYLDYWVICDTGSTDGTQKFIENYFKEKNIQGELHQDNWVNFGYNRSKSLEKAYRKADYLLLLDADFVVNIISKNFKTQLSNENIGYYILQNSGSINYRNLLLVSGKIKWKYIGVTHEYITSNETHSKQKFDLINVTHTCLGNNRKDKFTRDIALLEMGVKDEPNNARYCFYLAESYKNIGNNERAIIWYKKRVEMGEFAEEVYYSLYSIGVCKERNWRSRIANSMKIEGDFEKEILYDYLKAFNYRPTRLEALYKILHYYRIKKEYTKAFGYGIMGYNVEYPNDLLFIEKDIYEYKFIDELSISAYYVGFYQLSYDLTSLLLNEKKYPKHYRARLYKNLKFSENKIS